MVRMAERNVEYQEEEMRQLEKMYKADDIKEETEKIVLKRARNNVEQAKFTLDFQRVQRDDSLKITLPRQVEKARNPPSGPIWNGAARSSPSPWR